MKAWTVGVIALAAFSAVGQGRDVVSLDGAWDFRLDPESEGEAGGWFSPSGELDGTIQVPGAWDAQGFGEETDKLHHSFVGKGWYRRTVAIPAEWRDRRVFLCVGGVHRYAKVWVNGQYLGEHIGYLSPFEHDITPHVTPGESATIAICVDSEQRWDIDTIIGCFDIIDYMDTYWGGIWGHVSLEARSAAYLKDLFVQPKIAPAGCRVEALLEGDAAGCDAVRLEVLAADGTAVSRQDVGLDKAKAGNTGIGMTAEMPGAALWSPNSPTLYTARLSLLKEGALVDQVETRFGLRTIAIDGTYLLLNGKRVFLHGYGDDCIYPETMAGPSDKAVYLKRLRVAKEYGFNHVRHHSHLLPPEYYEACDEVGMLVSAEFPIAYQRFYDQAKEPALDLYRTEWAAVIKRFRNHPSVFDWSMGNEMYEAIPLAQELYRAAKNLDPTRPVVDSDGVWVAGFATGERDRDTLDFYFMQFDVFNTPLDKPGKYDCPKPKKPVVSHETGNYVTFPRLDLIDLFQHNFKPFWLVQTRNKLEQIGLLDEAELWAENSERLYFLLHKINTESLRKESKICGHHWWLLQDYWTTTNGLVDTYFRPKPGIAPAKVRQFNADVVLLENGLELTYRSGENLDLAFLVSNYSPEALANGMLGWRIEAEGRVIAEGTEPASNVPQGEVVELKRVGVPVPTTTEPVRLTVATWLEVGDRRYENDWTTWAYPASPSPPLLTNPVYASPELASTLAAFGVHALPEEDPLPGDAAYVGTYLSKSMFDAMSRGACVFLIQPPALLPTALTRYKTAWWHGNESDNNAGTMVYNHPVARPMAPEGWCDTGWFRLIENSHGYILNDLPTQPEVLVRGIEVWSACRNKALLFQAGVGKGSLIVCGLNLEATVEGRRAPEAEWLLARLVEHASTLPKPAAQLPADFLRERAADMPTFEGPFVEGFSRLVRNDGEESMWFTYREARAANYICRQTAKGHAVEWKTAPVPDAFAGDALTFVFAGSLGWISEPEKEGFTFSINGEDIVRFDVASAFATWRNDDRGVAVSLFSKTVTNEDNAGLFYVRVPAALLELGKPCRFAVRSNSEGSKRWFALHPYGDVLGSRERQ